MQARIYHGSVVGAITVSAEGDRPKSFVFYRRGGWPKGEKQNKTKHHIPRGFELGGILFSIQFYVAPKCVTTYRHRSVMLTSGVL